MFFCRLSILHLVVVLLSQVGGSYLNHMSEYSTYDRNDETCSRYFPRRVLCNQLSNREPFPQILVEEPSARPQLVRR